MLFFVIKNTAIIPFLPPVHPHLYPISPTPSPVIFSSPNSHPKKMKNIILTPYLATTPIKLRTFLTNNLSD